MAINFSAMLGQLKMGVDILPKTDPDTVPHTQDPNHIPHYHLELWYEETEEWSFYKEGPVDELVTEAHADPRTMCLMEDDYPVMTIS